MGEPLQALWYDGRSSRAQEVVLRLQPGPGGPALQVEPAAALRPPLLLAHEQVGWPQAWSARRAPARVVVDLRGQGSLEIADVPGWQAALQAAGHRAPLAQRMQTRWTVFLLVLAAAIVALAAFYRWGTPWAATQITREVPLAWETRLSHQALLDFDGRWLKPSKLPSERQQALRARFEALARDVPPQLRRYAGYQPQLQLLFRSGMGPNAFALPGGTIVMTDALVERAAKEGLPDDALLGVLAHEIGHVMHRHTTRMVVEQGVLNIGLGLALGEVSSLLSVGGSLLTGLAYRRSHEAEADCFAYALMQRAGLKTEPLADLLLAIDAKPAAHIDTGWGSLLSDHPATPQRARDLKQGQAPACR